MWISTRRAVLLLLLVGTAACRNGSSARSGDQAPGTMREHPSIAFPRQSPGRQEVLEALVEGRLVLEDGCLRVRTPQGESYLVLWPPRAELGEEGARVVDRETGVEVEVGGPFRMSGGEVSSRPSVLGRLEGPPPERCQGPYWLAGNLLPLTP